MFPGCLHDFSRMFLGCSGGSYWPGEIWWSFQMKVSKGIRWSPTIWWSQKLLFDDPQVFDDPQLFDDPQVFDDQLVVWTLIIEKSTMIPPSLMVLFQTQFVAIFKEFNTAINLLRIVTSLLCNVSTMFLLHQRLPKNRIVKNWETLQRSEEWATQISWMHCWLWGDACGSNLLLQF